ncbi:MAG: hypothetical protein DI536_12850 [Archangium gephyra]|uniref:DUF1552 domain-containing protein n=1 Tax=Archangium gephyra TaxID=48 RepID=A0A2W5VB73_9BACT|nr:MAG: hypothetical protein DI536_12850 [Archangium gephyra]
MKFDRRLLLKAAAGAPLLKLLSPELAWGQTQAPRRIVFWFQPNGVAHDYYHVRPDSTETDWGYDPAGDKHTMLPLVPFKDITVHFDSTERVSTLNLPESEKWTEWAEGTKAPFGLTDLAGCTGPHPLKPLDANGNPTRELTIGHESQVSMLTGRFPVGTVTTTNGTSTVEFKPQGDSLDVALGKAIGGTSRVKSLQLGVNSFVNFGLSVDGGRRLPVVDDPRLSFQSLFAGIPQTPGVDPAAEALAKKMKRRGASFAAAYERFSALKGGMSSPDQTRLQQHFDAYRDVETRLTRAPDLTNLACHSPDAPPSMMNLGDPLKLPDRMQLMMDQAVLALACDVTRVMTLSWTFAATNQVFSFLPGFNSGTGGLSPDGHHPLSHDAYNGIGPPQTEAQFTAYDKLRRIERWYAERLSSFLTALKNVREPDGSTLLDNTLVVVINEMNHSGSHNNSNMPIRLYGNLTGRVRSGRYIKLPATPLNNLYTSIGNALGVPWTGFGEARFDYRFCCPGTRWQWKAGSNVVGPLDGLLNS